MKTLLLCGAVCLGPSAFSQSIPSPHTLPPVTVRSLADQENPPLAPATENSLQTSTQELSRTLADLPGVSLRLQGCHAGEPVLRGLGWERVSTQYNGLGLHGACPSRMDPPVNLFTAENTDAVRIELGPASVTHGPVPIAGRILLDDGLSLAAVGDARHSGSLYSTAATTGDALGIGGRVRAATPGSAVQLEGSVDSAGDYTSANGTKVPANLDSRKASALWKQRLSDSLTLDLGTRWIHDRDILYLSLPMDSRYAKTLLGTARLEWTPEQAALQSVVLRGGVGTVDHLMDNRDKANRRMMEASTPSTADSATLGLLSAWELYSGRLELGLDASRLDRDALRTRFIRSTGMTFQDPIWPELHQEQIGLFGEWEGALTDDTGLRAGIRIDRFTQDAGKADARIVPGPGVGPTTVAEAWQEVGGSAPGVVKTEDTPVSATLALQHALTPDWGLQLGLSRVEAVPNLTQRYLSFGPVPGGYGVGTPSLDMEEKWEIDLRSEAGLGEHRLGAALFVSRIHDYLLPTTVAMRDVTGDGRPDRVKGTVNRDADLYGAEASALLRLSRGLTLPLSASMVRGELRDTGTPLPEIPPLDLRAALRWEDPEAQLWYLEAGGVFAARQDRIDPDFGENETPSSLLFHLRGGLQLHPAWRLEAGIENLFDRQYHQHLTREALLPQGDLRPGDDIPGPGRGFHLAVKARW